MVDAVEGSDPNGVLRSMGSVSVRDVLEFWQRKGTLSLIGAGINHLTGPYLGKTGSVFHHIQREVDTYDSFSYPLSYRLWLYRNGFLSESGVLFGLTESNVESYLSSIDMYLRTHELNGRASVATEDKQLFQQLIGTHYAEYLPTVYGRIDGGDFVRSTESADSTGRSLEELVAAEGKLVLKPIRGGGGDDVYVVDDSAALSQIPMHNRYVVTEFIRQHEYAATIFPDSVNTVRLLTMIDPETNEAFIPAAVHRFGTVESGPVDNWSAGGMTAGIDRETGVLGRAVTYPGTRDRLWHDAHPDTGEPIAGVEIPGWKRVREVVREIATTYGDTLKYVGWDVVVTADERPFVIIEGNSAPGVTTIQPHVPLLADPRVKRFFRHHGAI